MASSILPGDVNSEPLVQTVTASSIPPGDVSTAPLVQTVTASSIPPGDVNTKSTTKVITEVIKVDVSKSTSDKSQCSDLDSSRSSIVKNVQLDGSEKCGTVFDLTATVLHESATCTDEECLNGVTLSTALKMLPTEIRNLTFRNTHDLAHVICMWRTARLRDGTIENILSGNYWTVTPSLDDWVLATSSFVDVCEKRRKILQETQRYPLCCSDGTYFGEQYTRTTSVMAMETVRSLVRLSLGATSAQVAVIGGWNGRTLSKAVGMSEWISVGEEGDEAASKDLSFPSWSSIADEWQCHFHTKTVIVCIEANEWEEAVKAIYSIWDLGSICECYVLAPPYTSWEHDNHIHIRNFWIANQIKYSKKGVTLCGYNDGRIHSNLCEAFAMPGFYANRNCQRGSRWTVFGALQIAKAMNYHYECDLSTISNADCSKEDGNRKREFSRVTEEDDRDECFCQEEVVGNGQIKRRRRRRPQKHQ